MAATIPSTLLNDGPGQRASQAAEKIVVVSNETSGQGESTESTESTESSGGFLLTGGDEPLNWSRRYKWTVVALVAMVTMIDVFATIMFLPAVPQILNDLGTHNQLYSVILVSIWEVGEGLGPFIIAPLSEIFGRLPVFHVANFLFLVFTIAAAVSTNLNMLVAFRFLNGLTVASLVLGPVVIGDMFAQESRGQAMAVVMLPALLGPVLAPTIGGFASQNLGWRWNFWLISIAIATLQVACIIVMRESYRPSIVRKVQRRTALDHGPSIKLASGEERQSSLEKTLLRPLKMMLLSPIVLALSLYSGIQYSYQYIILTTINTLYENEYHFSQGATGLIYLAVGSWKFSPSSALSSVLRNHHSTGIGMIVGALLYGLFSDKYLLHKSRSTAHMKPEHRLPPLVIGGIASIIGLFFYGWTAEARTPWILPLIGTAFVGLGMMLCILPTENYLVDAFGDHAASAITGELFFRAMLGAVVPLAGPPLNQRLGYGWGSSVLGFIALAMLPVPILLIRYGEWMRNLRSGWSS
ncbi:MAG: hypothetical protein Q9219_002843 [cf. Caloplaca sp. 3 TL-2023]